MMGTGTGIFLFFLWYRKKFGACQIWYCQKVSEPVSVKFGIGKKYRNRYRKNFVPEKSLGTGIEKSTGIGIENIWYREKVSVSL